MVDDVNEASLADLMDLDVSDIAEVRYESIPAGSYVFEITNADFSELVKDDGKRFVAEVEMKILEVKAVLEPGVDKESLVGKTHREKMFVNPGAEQDKIAAAIGRIRAFVSDVGMDSSGKLGDIVKNLKGHTFGPAKIVKQKDKDDKSIEYARLKLEPKKK
jgi:hypothetical protein